MDTIRELIRDVPDFPKKGIIFKDLTPVLEDPHAFKKVINALFYHYENAEITKIVAIESRGFIFGAPLAYAMGCGLVIVRKPNKLPRETYSSKYALEYGEDSVHIHQDSLTKEDRVIIVDDLLATGGTLKSTLELVENCGANVFEVACVVELLDLKGREKLAPNSVHTLLTY